MRLPAHKTVLAFSLMTLSHSVAAGGEPQLTIEPEGVLLDISQIDPKNDPESAIFKATLDTAEDTAGSATTKSKHVAAKATYSVPVPIIIEASAVQTSTGKAVAVDLSGIDVSVAKSIEANSAKAIPKSTTKTAEPVKTPPKAKSESTTQTKQEAEDEANVLTTIGNAMRPSEQIAPLGNNRFSFYLSEQVLFTQYEVSTARFNLDDARTHLGFLYSEERDTVIQGGLAIDATFTKSVRLSFGTRAYAALLNQENEDAFAAALGAETAYKLPFKALPIEFGASLYYAPDILTFGTADRTIDAQVDLTFPVRSQFSVFGGYRFMQIDTRPNDREVDNRLHLGFRWDFE